MTRCRERQQMLLRQCGGSRSALPWCAIYRLRAQLPPAVVVDGGSGYCKFGMSSDGSPSGRIATFLEFGNIEAPSLARLRALFSSIYASMRAIPSNHPVVVSEPLAFLPETREAQEGRRHLREVTCAVLFSALRVPSICLVDQATLALLAAGAASGVVVNIGFRSTTILPIMRARTACSLLPFYCLPLGAMRVTGHLSQLLHDAGIVCQSMFTVRTIKESLCFVARDFEAAMRGEERGVRGTCEVPGEGAFTLGRERFLAPEVLFQPHLCGLGGRGIQQAVAQCIVECAARVKAFQAQQDWKARHSHTGEAPAAEEEKEKGEEEKEKGERVPAEGRGVEGATGEMGSGEGAAGAGGGVWGRVPAPLSSEDVAEAIGTVVVAGGTSALPGIAERLHVELQRLLPPPLADQLSVKAVGPYGTWMGGRTVATGGSAGGSGYCKFGMSSEASPSGRIATFRESGNIEAPSLSRLRALFSSIYTSMKAIPSNHPVVVSEPLAFLPETREAQERRRRVRGMTCAVLFKAFRVPSICLVDQATLALLAAGAASGVVVNIGLNSTTILPVIRGRTACSLLPFYCLPLGAMRVTGHLTQLLHEGRGGSLSMSTVRTIMESLCFVARDFEAAMRGEERGVWGTCEVPGEGAFTLGRERFLAPEVLFQPHLCGLGCGGIQLTVALCLLECIKRVKAFLKARHGHAGGAAAAAEVGERAEEGEAAPGEGRGGESATRGMGSGDGAAGTGGGVWEREVREPAPLASEDVAEAIGTVVLAGGTSVLPGIAERLHVELQRLLPPPLADKLSVKAVGPYGAWMGGRTVATVSATGRYCITALQPYVYPK
ncbi:unnamed protein product [Closterium sp. Naga37s-1]|nr:unnamed protein product [Closterium sp. Naga37s-1]